MAKPKLTLYYDLHSPYSYLAFWLIRNSPVFKSCEITYIPVLLVAFIQATGLQPPWSSPNKVAWMTTDLRRSADLFHIPWTPGWPENYPFKATTLKVQRVMTATSIDHPDRYPEVISALYHAFWAEKKGIQLPEVHYPILASILGEDSATKVLERSSSDEIKAQLRHNTDSAIAGGCPGLPWVVATDADGREEQYFGFDHLGQVAQFLGLKMVIGPNL